jgi:hypothetical protein
VLSAVGVGATLLFRKLIQKSDSRLLDAVLGRARGLSYDVVSELNQTVVEQLKAAAADGKLTKDEAGDLLDAAVERIKASLGTKALRLLTKQLGSMEQVEGLLETLVESAVRSLKR